MKKLLILLLLPMVWFADGHAAEQFATFKAVRYSVRQSLGFDTSSINALTDSALNVIIREGIVVVNNAAHCDKVEWVFTTAYLDNTYDIDSNIIGIISVRWQKSDSVKSLLYVPQNQWYTQEHKTTSGQKDGYLRRPSSYDYTDDVLFLYPTPTIKGSDYDTIFVVGWRAIPSLDTVSTLSAIPEKYRPIVVKYTSWQAALRARRELAASFQEQFIGLLGGVEQKGASGAASK